jgi:septal ring factor EnvC (AmiA/AmiB activator)
MLWALLGTLGGGVVGILIQTIRLAQAQTKIAEQKSRADKAETKAQGLEKDLSDSRADVTAMTAKAAEDKLRYEKVCTDAEADIKRLQALLSTCQDPRVINERLNDLGKIVKIV